MPLSWHEFFQMGTPLDDKKRVFHGLLFMFIMEIYGNRWQSHSFTTNDGTLVVYTFQLSLHYVPEKIYLLKWGNVSLFGADCLRDLLQF